MNRTATRALSLAVVMALPLSACSSTPDTHAISVENCGRTVNFAAAPEKVTLLDNTPVPALDALGVLDRVSVKAGVFQPDYYPSELTVRLSEISTLTDRLDATGHLQISREAVVATNPDLVIGATDTVNHATLQPSGIPLLEEPAFCGGITGDVTFDHVYEQVDLYGTVFGKTAEAAAYNSELRKQVADLTDRADGQETRTAAVLYPTVGGGVTYAYGRGSMSAPILEAAGLRNVFDDQADRVFEVSTEEIIDRDPDVIIALYTDGDEKEITRAVTSLPGADALTAVHDQAILPLLLNFAEPPTPLSVAGLEQVITFLEETR